VHRTDPSSGRDETRDVDRQVGAVVLRQDGGLLLAADDGFRTLDWDSGSTELLAPVEADRPELRMNDGKVDPRGRFWAGTMRRDEMGTEGSLYRLDPDHSVTRLFGGVGISNGLDWTTDRRTMYYIDTTPRALYAFDYDDATGAISGRRALITFPEERGVPDGMTLDADGYLWVALWGGWAVQRYDPDGQMVGRVEVPASQVTSVAFGGPDLDELYITCARRDNEGDPRQPAAGGIFRFRPGVQGRACFRFAS